MHAIVLILVIILLLVAFAWVTIEQMGLMPMLQSKIYRALPRRWRARAPDWLLYTRPSGHPPVVNETEEPDEETGGTTMIDAATALRMAKVWDSGSTVGVNTSTFFHQRTAALLQRYGKTNPARLLLEMTKQLSADRDFHWRWITRIHQEWVDADDKRQLDSVEWQALEKIYGKGAFDMTPPEPEHSVLVRNTAELTAEDPPTPSRTLGRTQRIHMPAVRVEDPAKRE